MYVIKVTCGDFENDYQYKEGKKLMQLIVSRILVPSLVTDIVSKSDPQTKQHKECKEGEDGQTADLYR